MPDPDPLAVPRPGADTGKEPGERLGGVHRVDQDSLGPAQDRRRFGGLGRRPAVTVADLRLVEVDRRVGGPGQLPTVTAIDRRRSAADRATTTPVTAIEGGRPARKPAWVPPVAVGNTTRSMVSPSSAA